MRPRREVCAEPAGGVMVRVHWWIERVDDERGRGERAKRERQKQTQMTIRVFLDDVLESSRSLEIAFPLAEI